MILDEKLFINESNSKKLTFNEFVNYLYSINNGYHAFSKVSGEKGSGYRYTLSNNLTQEQKDYLAQYPNVQIGSATYKYAPEQKYDTVILLNRMPKVEESKDDTEDMNYDIGYDHYGSKYMTHFDGPAYIEYNGGAGNIQWLVKGQNHRYYWENSANLSEPYVFDNYDSALKVQIKYGGEILPYRTPKTSTVKEDIVKTSKGKWVNKGKEGTHGEFKTKKAARAQQKAMYAQGFKGDGLKEDIKEQYIVEIQPDTEQELFNDYAGALDYFNARVSDYKKESRNSDVSVALYKVVDDEIIDTLKYWKKDETLKEEYGYYKDEPYCEEIANELENGVWFGETENGTPWELTINGLSKDEFSPAFAEYLAREVSYPVRDGHLKYRDLDVIISKDALLGELDRFIPDLVKIGFDRETIDEWLSSSNPYAELITSYNFDIAFDEDEWEENNREDVDLEEDYTHFTYKSGANPYIAKTDKEAQRILNKYKGRVNKIKDGFYEVDDTKEDTIAQGKAMFTDSQKNRNFCESFDNKTILDLTIFDDNKIFEKKFNTIEELDNYIREISGLDLKADNNSDTAFNKPVISRDYRGDYHYFNSKNGDKVGDVETYALLRTYIERYPDGYGVSYYDFGYISPYGWRQVDDRDIKVIESSKSHKGHWRELELKEDTFITESRHWKEGQLDKLLNKVIVEMERLYGPWEWQPGAPDTEEEYRRGIRNQFSQIEYVDEYINEWKGIKEGKTLVDLLTQIRDILDNDLPPKPNYLGDEEINESVNSELIDEFAYEYGLSKAEAKKRLKNLSKEEQEKKLKLLKQGRSKNAKADFYESINGAFYGRQDVRDISIEPGYYEWILKVDGQNYYSFGDLSETVDLYERAEDFANSELDYFDYATTNYFDRDEEDSRFFDNAKEIGKLAGPEYEEIYQGLIDAYVYYMGNIGVNESVLQDIQSDSIEHDFEDITNMSDAKERLKKYGIDLIKKDSRNYVLRKDGKEYTFYVLDNPNEVRKDLARAVHKLTDSIKDAKPDKPEFPAKGKWEWDEVQYDWYDTGRGAYYEEIKRDHGIVDNNIKDSKQAAAIKDSKYVVHFKGQNGAEGLIDSLLGDKNLKENIGLDIAEYQKWVDYDMKKYGRISSLTNHKIKKAGLKIVKDKYGDYEVIANESIKEGYTPKQQKVLDAFYKDMNFGFDSNKVTINRVTDNSVEYTLDGVTSTYKPGQDLKEDLEREFTIHYNREGFEFGGYGAVRVKATDEDDAKEKFLAEKKDNKITISSIRPTTNEDVRKGIRLLDTKKVEESLSNKELDDMIEIAHKIGLNTLDDLQDFLKRQQQPSDATIIDTLRRYSKEFDESKKYAKKTNEDIDFSNENYLLKPYWYSTTHGVTVGSIPKNVKVWTWFDGNNKSFFATSDIISTEDLKEYEIKEETPNVEDIPEHSRIQIQKYLEQPLTDNDMKISIKAQKVEEDLSADTNPIKPRDTGLAQLLIDAINGEWETIQLYNDISINANNEKIAEIIKQINADEYTHVGLLQTALDLIAPNTNTNLEKGNEQANEIIDNKKEKVEDVQ